MFTLDHADHVTECVQVRVADRSGQSAAGAEVAGYDQIGQGFGSLGSECRSQIVQAYTGRQVDATACHASEVEPALVGGRRAEGVNVADVDHLLRGTGLVDRIRDVAVAEGILRGLQVEVAERNAVPIRKDLVVLA